MKTLILTWTTLLLAALAPRLCLAQSPMDTNAPMPTATEPSPLLEPIPPLPEYEPSDTKPSYVKSPAGMYFIGGGGPGGFVTNAMTDVTKVGGAYDVRLVYGSRSPIAFEAAYIGSATSINALGLANNAYLFGNGAEGSARFNVLSKGNWQPYVTVGAAWKHYALRSDVNTSNVNGSDDVLEVPVATGIAWRYAGFIADARAAYRQSFMTDLIGHNDLSNWTAQAHLGFEF